MSQNVPECPRMSEDLQGYPRMSQDVQGRPRMTLVAHVLWYLKRSKKAKGGPRGPRMSIDENGVLYSSLLFNCPFSKDHETTKVDGTLMKQRASKCPKGHHYKTHLNWCLPKIMRLFWKALGGHYGQTTDFLTGFWNMHKNIGLIMERKDTTRKNLKKLTSV